MNKKLAVSLLIVLGFVPLSVFGFTNPLKSYNLYDDVKAGNANNGGRESAMGEYYNNSLRSSSQSSSIPSVDDVNKQMEGLEKMININKNVNSTMKNSGLSDEQKLLKLKGYNTELRTVLNTYFPTNSSEFKKVIQILDENDKLFSALESSDLSESQKMKAVAEHQNKLSSIMQSMNKGSSSGSFVSNKSNTYGASLSSYDLSNPSYVAANYVSSTGRNAYLRQSSKKVYSDSSEPQWTQGPSFYENPSLESIKEKYRKSNFAGAMQEAESYVRENPNDTIAFYYLAMSYAKTGNKENAIKAYEKVISLNDSPLIVKYATNGRNCVMGNDSEARCYQDVNIPEIKYPYREMAETMDMTPINVQALIDSNVAEVERRVGVSIANPDAEAKDGDNKKPTLNLPFGTQDEKLDEFIKAPYGNGFSEDLNKENRLKELKRLQDSINKEQDNLEQNRRNIEDVKKFDNKKSDSETIKLAYNSSFDFEQLKNDPEYVRNKKEMDELNMLFGGSRDSSRKDLMDIIPSLTDKENGISPEMFSQMMMNSIMPDIIGTNNII